jgi:integrase
VANSRARAAAGDAGDHLWKRGEQWYLRLAIPRSMQHLFLSSTGKPMSKIVEPLGDSPSAAKDEARYRVALYTDVFKQIKAGLITTREQVADAMRGPSEPDYTTEQLIALQRWRPSPEALRRMAERRLDRQARWFEEYGGGTGRFAHFPLGSATGEQPAARPAPTAAGETITQAAEAWYAEMTRDEAAAPRKTTIDGHRLRVKAFTDKVGDLPLTAVTRAMASDFLAGLDVKARTKNNYADTLNYIFKSAGRRGRFSRAKEDNPFDDQRSKVAKNSYSPFTVAELQTLFAALPREVKPVRDTPETAMSWCALIALYSGMRLEEIAQLKTADVREEAANGATVWSINIHNGGENKLKNEPSARLIPVHSELVRLGFLDYVAALPKGPLFPGLTRRESKGGKIGARVGELFRKKLKKLGLKREGICFHSFPPQRRDRLARGPGAAGGHRARPRPRGRRRELRHLRPSRAEAEDRRRRGRDDHVRRLAPVISNASRRTCARQANSSIR